MSGHGIVAPEYRWNDYAGVDMAGKIALVMVNDPPATAEEPELFAGRALTYYGRWTYKFEEAARQGAAGAILIHTDESATYPWQVVQSSWSGTQYSIPSVQGAPRLALKAWVTDQAAREIAKRAGKDLDALRKAASARGAMPTPFGIQCDRNDRPDGRRRGRRPTSSGSFAARIRRKPSFTRRTTTIWVCATRSLAMRLTQIGSTTAPSTMHRAWPERSR